MGEIPRSRASAGCRAPGEGRLNEIGRDDGQLAPLHAYLEMRPIAVTDEGAADQVLESRRRLYDDILPALKAQGRKLFVISHDGRYFSFADRVIRLHNGALSAFGTLGVI